MIGLSAFSKLQLSFTECFVLVVLVAGALILYALWKKGDVTAELSRGKTVFKLEAKERSGKPR